MNAIETFEVGKYKVEIYADECPMNPRENCDNDDVIVAFHKRYRLGDDVEKHGYRWQDFDGWDALEAQIIKDHDPVVIKPLYLYDHSGITISTSPFSCPWDSGQIGFVFMPKKGAYNAYMTKRITKKIRERCEQYVDANVKKYDDFISGNCYGYRIEDENGEEIEDLACWGFYGMEYVKKEATEAVNHLIANPPKPKPQPEDPNQLKLALTPA